MNAVEDLIKALNLANKRIDHLEKYNLDLATESHNKSALIKMLESCGGWIETDSYNIGSIAIVFIPLPDSNYMNMVTVGEEGDLFDMDGSYIGYHASEVTHWIPLPKPPEGSVNE